MPKERQKQAREIFFACLECKTPEARAEVVVRECGGDAALEAAVGELLAAHDANDSFLEKPLDGLLAGRVNGNTLDTVAVEATPDPLGTLVGPYKLLQQIGEGGFGVVYMAEQMRGVRRKVALKIIKPGMDTREVIARFEAERQALALMDHPHIAKILDAGTVGVHASACDLPGSPPEDTLKRELQLGRPYFVMELVRGAPLTEFCDEARLSTRERLALFVQVCRAVQHAHQKGIIHRDLKPSNILITMHDDKPVPKVIDFGVAKALSRPLTDKTLFTAFGQMIGTPLYMSPEQAQLSGLDVDTRSDIYSLGVLLYELLTGATPFDKETLRKFGFDEMRRMIRDDDPPRPSARISTFEAERLSTVCDSRRIDPNKFRQHLRGELDWIVMKALEKDRNRRYESAAAFAADVERHLNDDPVQACPPSTAYRLRKTAKRHTGALAAAALVLMALLIGTGVAIWQAIRATDAEHLAEARFLAAAEAGQREAAARQEAEQSTDETRRLLSRSYVAAGASQLERQDLARSLPWFVEALKVDAGDEGRELIHRTRIGMVLQQCPKLTAVFDASMPSGGVGATAGFDDRSRAIAVLCGDRVVQVFDVATGQAAGPPCETATPVVDVQLSPGGRFALIQTEDKFALREVASGAEILTFAADEAVERRFCFSPDGALLAWLGERSGKGCIWQTSTARVVASPTVPQDGPRRPRSSQHGESLIWRQEGDGAPVVWLWSLAGGPRKAILNEHARFLRDIQFSNDGRRFITASFDSTARIYDVGTMRPIGSPLNHDDYVRTARFSPDDRMVVTVSGDHTARLWDAETGHALTPPLVHDGELLNAEFSCDGRYVVTASWDTTARIWNTATGKLAYPVLAHHTQVARASFDALTRRVMTVTLDGLVHVWDLAAARAPGVILDDIYPGYSTAFTSEGKALLATGSAARLWDVETGQPLSPPLTLGGEVVNTAVIDAQERRIVTANGHGSLRVWDAVSFHPLTPPLPHDTEGSRFSVSRPSFGQDGGQVLAMFRRSAVPGKVCVWDSATGELLRWPVTESAHVVSASFSPNGRYLATASAVSESLHSRTHRGGLWALWDGRDGTPLGRSIAHDSPVISVVFSGDSRRVASVSQAIDAGQGELRVWDIASGRPLGPPIRQRSEFQCIGFSPDGARLVTAARDQTARVWDVATGRPLTPPMHHKERLAKAYFSPDGRLVMTTAGVDNLNSEGPACARLWDAATGQPVTPPLKHSDPTQIVVQGSFSPDGLRMATVSRDHTTRVWRIAREELPDSDLALLAQVLSSRKVDAVGSLSPLSGEEKLAAWKDLRSRYPDEFSASREQVLAWRHSEAVACMKTGRWREAKSHLDVLVEALPVENIGIRQRRAECAAALADWALAADDFQTMIDSGHLSYITYNCAALAALQVEDRRYREVCGKMLKAFTDGGTRNATYFTLWTAALAPGALDDFGPAIELGRRTLELAPGDANINEGLGAVLLRAGEYDEALERLTTAAEASPSSGTIAAYTAYFLAMTHHHLGDAEQARQWQTKADQQTRGVLDDSAKHVPWNRRLTLELLQAEAEALIGEEP